MEAKLKHLEFIQSAINRMTQNSFFLKGWSVTIAGGLLALSFKELSCFYLFISLAVLFLFWLLDSYYLSRERLFIKLYDRVRKKRGDEIDFSMDTREFAGEYNMLRAAFSRTMIIFYGGLSVIHLIILII